MTDKIDFKASEPKAEEHASKLLEDSGFKMKPITDHDGNVFMCFSKQGGGQFIAGKDFEAMDNNLSKLAHKVAEDVSKANNGAEVHVAGDLSAFYKSSFCSNGFMGTDEIVVGSGKMSSTPEVPNKEEINSQVKALTKQFQDSLQGDWGRFKQLDITGGITIKGDNADIVIANIKDERSDIRKP